MALIQLLAFETTGLVPAKCRIIELGFGVYDTKKDKVSCSVYLFDPEDADLEPVFKVHGRSGLIDALIDTAKRGAFDAWPDPPPVAHLRLCWSKSFITPHVDAAFQRAKDGSPESRKLSEWLGAVQSAEDWRTFGRIAQALRGLDGGVPAASRAEDKLKLMASLVKGML